VAESRRAKLGHSDEEGSWAQDRTTADKGRRKLDSRHGSPEKGRSNGFEEADSSGSQEPQESSRCPKEEVRRSPETALERREEIMI
jgi:hypothetical protein